MTPSIRLATPDSISASERTRWAALVAAGHPCDNPFLHPAFAEACDRATGGVEVAVLEEGGEPRGFLAFRRGGRGRTAEPAGGAMADVQAVVAAPGVAWDAAALLEACGLDRLVYDHWWVDPTDPPAGRETLWPAPIVDLSDGFEAYRVGIEAAGSSVLRQIDRKARKLAREVGPPRLELRGETDGLATWLEWKRRRVAAQGFRDPLADPAAERLLREVLEAREPGFEGIVSVLRAGDRPVAVHLGVLGNEVLGSWIPIFDPDPDLAVCSPGAVLHGELLRAAAAEGVTRVDLGQGENPLKSRLATGAATLAVGVFDRRPMRRATHRARVLARRVALAGPAGTTLRGAVRWWRAWRSR